jgi:hypothetical protein
MISSKPICTRKVEMRKSRKVMASGRTHFDGESRLCQERERVHVPAGSPRMIIKPDIERKFLVVI